MAAENKRSVPNQESEQVRPPKQKTAASRGKSFYRMVSLVTIVGLVVLWYLVTELGFVSERFLVSPLALFNEFGVLVTEGYANTPLWVHFSASLTRALSGFGLAALIAVPLGLLMGMSKTVGAIFTPVFNLLRPIPSIAYIPLVILWLGIGEASITLVIFMAAFLYIVLNTTAGISSVPEGFQRVAKNLGANRRQLFARVVFPAALPYIFVGLKTGLAVSWAVVVAAELVGAQQGLGYIIMDAATFFRIPDVYIGVILIGVVGLMMTSILEALESKIVHWAGK